MTKRVQRQNNLHLLDDEQKQALGKFQKDFQTAMPAMQELARNAKAIHQAMIDAPMWNIMETPKPDTVTEQPEMWSVGHAKVNYVDHIKTEGTQEQ